MLVELNDNNFEENTKDGIKLAVFTADWCGFCQKQKPILQEIADQNIWIGEINSDKNPYLVRKFEVSAFPTFILLKNGHLTAQFAGYRDKYNLLNTLLDYLK